MGERIFIEGLTGEPATPAQVLSLSSASAYIKAIFFSLSLTHTRTHAHSRAHFRTLSSTRTLSHTLSRADLHRGAHGRACDPRSGSEPPVHKYFHKSHFPLKSFSTSLKTFSPGRAFEPLSGSARLPEVDRSGRLLNVPLFRGSSGFESLILSHHFRFDVTCECNKEVVNDDDGARVLCLPSTSAFTKFIFHSSHFRFHQRHFPLYIVHTALD